MSLTAASTTAPSTKGRVLHAARFYDILAWVFLLGRERAFRERLVTLAELKPGDRVLDIGCGTGTLALAAKQRVGCCGQVVGVDASPEMVLRASRKVRRTGLTVDIKEGVVESLPLAKGQFDVVLSTLMLHHLPVEARRRCLSEIRRVLVPGGRVFIADFGEPTRRGGVWSHIHRHGGIRLPEIIGLLNEAGFVVTSSGVVGMGAVNYVLASTP